MNLSNTLAIKFGCKRTSISFNFTYKLIFGDGVACTKEMLKERDLCQLPKNACDILKPRALCRATSSTCVVQLGNKNT